jgi:ketosteroid isomerase-like protein
VSQEVEVVHRLFQAVKVWDVEGLLACNDPAVVITESAELPYGGTYTGIDGARRHATAFARTCHPWLVDPAEQRPAFLDSGAGAIAVCFRHQARNPDTGSELDTPEVGVHAVAGGRVTASTMYHLNPAELAAFLAEQSS